MAVMSEIQYQAGQGAKKADMSTLPGMACARQDSKDKGKA